MSTAVTDQIFSIAFVLIKNDEVYVYFVEEAVFVNTKKSDPAARNVKEGAYVFIVYDGRNANYVKMNGTMNMTDSPPHDRTVKKKQLTHLQVL